MKEIYMPKATTLLAAYAFDLHQTHGLPEEFALSEVRSRFEKADKDVRRRILMRGLALYTKNNKNKMDAEMTKRGWKT